MDAHYEPAIDAITAGDVSRLRRLVGDDPTLATARSSTGHPTLLQCVVLDRTGTPGDLELVRVLIDAGADLQGPLVACGSGNRAAAAALLMDRGANVNGSGGWSPLEEALYWNSRDVIALLLQRGASIHNLRIAAGLGRTDLVAGFFDGDGRLQPNAGTINWPWGDVAAIERSGLDRAIKARLAATVTSWTHDRQSIIDNAFVYASMHGHIDAARLLLRHGAQVNAIPGGFDYSGTGLHYAAMNGHRGMVEFLVEQGADVSVTDTKIGLLAAAWASHGGHPEIEDYLRQQGRR